MASPSPISTFFAHFWHFFTPHPATDYGDTEAHWAGFQMFFFLCYGRRWTTFFPYLQCCRLSAVIHLLIERLPASYAAACSLQYLFHYSISRHAAYGEGGEGCLLFSFLASCDLSWLFKSPTRVSQLTGTSPLLVNLFILSTLYPLLLRMDQCFASHTHTFYWWPLHYYCRTAFLFFVSLIQPGQGCRFFVPTFVFTPQGSRISVPELRTTAWGWGCRLLQGVHACVLSCPGCLLFPYVKLL